MSQQVRYPTTAAGTVTIAASGNTGAAVPAQALQVGGNDGSGNLRALSVSNTGVLNVAASSLPLPSGAATEATLLTVDSHITAMSAKLPAALGQLAMAASMSVAIASNQSAVPISVASLPLPSGAATEAKQDVGNSSLASIDGKLGSLGQKAMAGSAPVVIASDQSAIPLSAAEPTGLGTFDNVRLSNQTAGNDAFGNQINALAVYDFAQGASTGLSGTMSSGSGDLFFSTDGASNSILVSVDGTWTGSITATFGIGGNSPTISFRAFNSGTITSSITANGVYFVEGIPASGSFTLVNGVASGTANVDAAAYIANRNTGVWARQAGTWTSAATQSGTWNITNISGTVSLPTGAATETTLAAASAKLPATLGQKTMANSMAVVIASDQSAVTTSETTASTSSVTSVASSATSVSLLALNTSRKGATFFNDSTSVLYLKLGATASTTSYTVQIQSMGYYELPFSKVYTGAIDGIWSSANGNCRVTELT